MLKPLTAWITTNCGIFLKRWEYQTTLSVSRETCTQVKKQQLQLNMEQQTCTPFPILNHSVVPCQGCNCCFWTCIQVSQEAGKVVWYSHLFKNIPKFVVIHIVKGFSIVSEAEANVFLEIPYFFYDPRNAGSLISSSSAFSKPNLYIWKFLIQVLLKPSLKDFDHYLASM